VTGSQSNAVLPTRTVFVSPSDAGDVDGDDVTDAQATLSTTNMAA
jgi:hypothetical protein